ncbi:hypothetical protein CFOL_v3_30716 [Cephalotus follicularis]|uniref:Uncharacterized protein n=1 Tax=Cephalotus follicularis TaxID=3775 RepID=A0A1Q3D488_CEPFO|nr:hypothetical protein CFOL_v3_30716 [Cephalotus follicularis]
MGCNNSKLDSEGEVVPAKIRPLLLRKLEEIKRHKIANATLSKKQLLKDGVEEDDHSSPPSVHDINESKSISSSEGSTGPAKVTPEPVSNKECEESAEIMNQEKCTKQDDKAEEEREKNVVEPLVYLEEKEVVAETNQKEDEEEDEDERRLRNVDDALICPGSPSFRVYCIQSSTDDKDESKEDSAHQKSWSSDSFENPESDNSSEDSETKIKKKAKKGINFRRVIPKGTSGSVKHLLNVRSCYYPTCSGHDNTRLLSARATA